MATHPKGRSAHSHWLSLFQPPRSGSVLILAVWVMSLLTILVGGLGSRGLVLLDVTERLEEQLRAYSGASGGVQHALFLMEEDPTPGLDGLNEDWTSMKEGMPISIPGVNVDFGNGLVDEDGKLNLNTAPVDVLENLFRNVGLSREDAQAVAAAVADWRDEDDDERDYGAEEFYYRGLDNAYDCKDGLFESIEELLLVRGMSPVLWNRISPLITVYGSGQLNINTANDSCLSALGLSSQGVAGLLAYRVGEDGTVGTVDDRIFKSVQAIVPELGKNMPIEDQNRLAQLNEHNFLGVASDAFQLSVTAQSGSSKNRVHLTCVLERSGRIRSWREE